MKIVYRFISTILSFFIFLYFIIFLSSCSKTDVIDKLSTPINLNITEEEYLLWDDVPNATSYKITINTKAISKEFISQKPNLDLFELLDNYDDYKISIIALDDNNKYKSSDSSSVLDYKLSSQDDYLNYDLVNNLYEISVKENDKISHKVIIPSKYKGKTVNSLKAFSNCSEITSILIPDSVVTIGGFSHLDKLQRIKLSNSIEDMKNHSFYDCDSIKELELPTNLKKISSNAIENCKSLEKVKIGKNVEKIRYDSFKNCSILTDIVIVDDNPNYFAVGSFIIEKINSRLIYTNSFEQIPKEVRIIGSRVFYNNDSIVDLVIPNWIVSVEDDAFSMCDNLKKVIIEEGVKDLQAAFKNCQSLKEIELPSTLSTISDNFFGNIDNLDSIKVSSLSPYFCIEDNCLIDKKNNKLIYAINSNSKIPNYIVEIGKYAFKNSKISNIVVPSSVKKIGDSAFEKCENLIGIVLEEGIEEIGYGAFKDCYNVNSITLPKSLKCIGDFAFCETYCPIIMYDTIENIGEYSFKETSLYTNLSYDRIDDINISEKAFYDSSYLLDCIIENGMIKGVHFYNFSQQESGQTGLIMNCGFNGYSLHLSQNHVNRLYIIEVPNCKEALFMGFSLDENLETIFYEAELVEYNYYSVYENDRLITKKCYAIKFDISNIINDTVLYAVWN